MIPPPLHPEVVKVVEVLKRALGITDELVAQPLSTKWPDYNDPNSAEQRWDAGPISVVTPGYYPDPSGYSGGQQSWMISIESLGFSMGMGLHDYAGWQQSTVLKKDPRHAPILDALLAAGISYGWPREQ